MVAAKAGALAQGIAPRSLQVVQEQLSIRFAAQRGTAAPARLRAGLTRWKVRLSLLREALS